MLIPWSILFPVLRFSLMPTETGRSRWGSCSRPCRGSWETSSRPRRSPRWSRKPTLMEMAPSTLKVTLCGDRHPYLPGVIFFPSWPFLLILPQFEVGGGRVRFGNCLLPHFLPMSFPKAHASHLSLINICTWPLLGTACPEADSDSTFPIPSLFPGHLCYRNRNSHPKEGGLVSCWDAGSDSWGSSSGSSFTNDVVLSQSLSLLQCQISHLQNGGKDDTFLPKFYRKAKRNRALQTPLLVCCLEQPSSFHWLSLSYTPGWCPPPHLSCQARHPRAPITPTATSEVMLTRDIMITSNH